MTHITVTELPSCRKCKCKSYITEKWETPLSVQYDRPLAYSFSDRDNLTCLCDCHTAYNRIVLVITKSC